MTYQYMELKLKELEKRIEALEQELYDDRISRKAAINAMIKLEQDDIKQYGCSIPEGFNSDPAIEALKSLPPVTQKENFEMKDYSILDDLVPKTQELHRAIFDKGYTQGQKDILEQHRTDLCESHDHDVMKAYNDGEAFILDMLRKEIELIQVKQVNCDECKFIIKQILEIIDKYEEGFILPLPESEENILQKFTEKIRD